MQARIILPWCVIVALFSSPVSAADAVADCKAFFDKFQKCVDSLKGEQQDQARIFMKTLRATLGLSDSLNYGDPIALGIMCHFTIEEVKKDQTVQTYHCNW